MIDTIVFYDGDCAFCQRSIVRILRADVRRSMCVAALQSRCAGDVLAVHAASLHSVDSLVVWHRGRIYVKARALRCLGHMLGGVWAVIALLSYAVPLCALNRAYDAFAKRRHRLRMASCVVPQRAWQAQCLTDDVWDLVKGSVWHEARSV